MPVYCTTTINGNDHYYSTIDLPENKMWLSEIVSINQVTLAMSKQYGGYLKPVFGDTEFLPTAFKDYNPLPDTINQKMEIGVDDQHTRVFYDSECALKDFDRTGITYRPLGKVSDVKDSSKSFNGLTLLEVFQWGCGLLGLTLDSTNARAVSPVVNHVNSSETLVVDLLDVAAASFTHYFYIDNGVLYLIDLLGNTGSRTISEFDFLPTGYGGRDTISLIKDGDFTVDGNTVDGSEVSATVWQTVQADVEAALTNILTVLEKKVFSIEIADVDMDIPIGTEITLLDESLLNPVIGVFTVTKKNINYSHADEKLIVEGRGTIS